MSAKVMAADHTNWRQLFREINGFKPGGGRDQTVFNATIDAPSAPWHQLFGLSCSPDCATIPESVRQFYGPPPKLVLKFRRALAWADRTFTRVTVRTSSVVSRWRHQLHGK